MNFSSILLPLLLLTLGVNLVQCDSCTDKCNFDESCNTTDYIQYNPCSYTCVCDGQYTNYVEDTFTQCGTEKRCYQGECINDVSDRCQDVYGNDYIGLQNPNNPCGYLCLNVYTPCILYEENVANGEKCSTYSGYAGVCLDGRCAAVVAYGPDPRVLSGGSSGDGTQDLGQSGTGSTDGGRGGGSASGSGSGAASGRRRGSVSSASGSGAASSGRGESAAGSGSGAASSGRGGSAAGSGSGVASNGRGGSAAGSGSGAASSGRGGGAIP